MSTDNNKRAGEEAVARVLLRLTERGFDCCMPSGDNAPWDLIAEYGGKVARLQVKSTTRRSTPESHVYYIRAQRGSVNNHRPYKKAEFDFLIAALPWACFIIPAEKVVTARKTTFGFWEVGKNKKRAEKCAFEEYKDAWHLMQ